MSEIVVTVKLPEGVDAEGVEVTVDPMPAQTEESGDQPDEPPPFRLYDRVKWDGLHAAGSVMALQLFDRGWKVWVHVAAYGSDHVMWASQLTFVSHAPTFPDVEREFAAARTAQVPEPPWAPGGGNNCKLAGWDAYFAGKPIYPDPFPIARPDLRKGWREGWRTAEAWRNAQPEKPHDD